jgi:pimeloyl-ACP methyl ester carboxylesterase
MAAKKSPPTPRSATVPASKRGQQLPPGIDRALLESMSLRLPLRQGIERRLSGDELERALISGEHARTLETYFGETEYADLRSLAARATRRTVRGGPRVLILPGILGSLLARVKSGRLDTIWIDFIDIMFGRLRELKLPDTSKEIRAFDVHQATYLKLKLWLRSEGFDADFHPFDWRQSIPELGRELAARIQGEPAAEVYLVAHSMGGLVARAAVFHGLPKLKRLVMLGTPNFGSFAPVMVFRGAYKFLRQIALLDLVNSADKLAGQVFCTHPGLTEMLPHRAKFGSLDLFDLGNWPVKGPRPMESLLKAAPAAQQQLAPPSEKFVMIAGIDQETTTGLRTDRGEFIFERSRAGDGTVPIDFAVLPDVLTYYHSEDHGSLPKNPLIHRALAEILRRGSTSLLSGEWQRTRADSPVEISETELAERFEASVKRSAANLSASDLRGVISEFAAPSGPELHPPSGLAPAETTAPTAVFDSVIVARRRQRRIEVRLARGSLAQVKTRACVLGLFENVDASGAAVAVDALVDGVLSEFRQRRMFSSAVGEMFIMPVGRNQLTADYVVLAGLGHFDRFNLQVLETVAENIARTLVRTDIEEFATVPIGAGSGIEVQQALEALLKGFFRGLDDADPGNCFRGITFCELDETRYNTLKWALYRLASSTLFDSIEVTLSELSLPPMPAARRDDPPQTPPSIYLNVRTVRLGGELAFESSLLTTGAKATVLSGLIKVRQEQLRQHLQQIESSSFNHKTLAAFGAELARIVLDDAIIAGLEGCPNSHVIVVHDAEASRIPWETICLEGRFPALASGMSRRYVADNLSVAKWLEQRRQDECLDVLLVVDPTEDLPGAREEGARVERLFASSPRVRLTRIQGSAATRARLRTEMESGQYDILHYAGHAFFDPLHISRSGIQCKDGPLSGAELADLRNLPSLVFFNACESGRLRKPQEQPESDYSTRNLRERIERSAGLAEAFLRGGVANYVGTYWPVGDASAKEFASEFYGCLTAGETLATSAHNGRQKVNAIASPDWADYIFYGSLDFRVKIGSENGEGRRSSYMR